jgi:bifunctional non-homologous end joining protein LigD
MPGPAEPDGPQWVYQIRLDGYGRWRWRTIRAWPSSRAGSLWTRKSYIVEALADLPDETIVDGESVGLDDTGRPEFYLMQTIRGEASRIYYYIFDLLCCGDRDPVHLPLVERRALLRSLVSIRDKRIRISDYMEAGAHGFLAAVREQQLEEIVGKRRDSSYKPGKRERLWLVGG